MKRTKALYVFILTVILVAFALLVTAKLAGAVEPHREQIFIPVVWQMRCMEASCNDDPITPEPPCEKDFCP